MPRYEYSIGLTKAGLTNVESLATPLNPPKGLYTEATAIFDKADGNVSGHGFPVVTWIFDVLTVAMVAQLRSFCTGQSAEVWIKTRISPDSLTSTDGYRVFNGIMIWPSQDYMTKRQMGGKYLGLEIQFRRLQPRYGAFSSAFSSAFDTIV